MHQGLGSVLALRFSADEATWSYRNMEKDILRSERGTSVVCHRSGDGQGKFAMSFELKWIFSN
jgi:hypothetical protein